MRSWRTTSRPKSTASVTFQPRLARFLAERMEMPGFTYKVIHDENRGWIILWKEYTQTGSVRGSGQFYERPYAWIDE